MQLTMYTYRYLALAVALAFAILLPDAVSGQASIGELSLAAGDTAVVPASAGVVGLVTDEDFVGLRYGPG